LNGFAFLAPAEPLLAPCLQMVSAVLPARGRQKFSSTHFGRVPTIPASAWPIMVNAAAGTSAAGHGLFRDGIAVMWRGLLAAVLSAANALNINSLFNFLACNA
jgi:hypothetical protein